ncbi:MAG: stage IV sporulation protein A [Lachnospiraceae bacterium]
MEQFNVYRDISNRTGGDIYIGVVGPVRTGKSTFIKRFMELVVLPEMEDIHSRERAKDELPMSASGKTITTTEPKFIPKEAVKIKLDSDIEVGFRLIDCVGFMVDGAAGFMEEGQERLVHTPWFEYEIPFIQAAEVGTRKVIHDHSTIGMVVTTDGTIGELKRNDYIPAEEKTVGELKKIGKPFLILLNSAKPYSEETIKLAKEMEKKYGVQVQPINCEQMRKEDVLQIMQEILLEFPISEIHFHVPRWTEILPSDHWMKKELVDMARTILNQVTWMKDVVPDKLQTDSEYVRQIRISEKNLANGSVSLEVMVKPDYYYQIISDYAGIKIGGEYELMHTLLTLAKLKNEYQKVEEAMNSVRGRGYGVVMPSRGEIQLEEPQVIRHGGKYGVKMRASAPSIHLIQSNIETEIAPIVGSEQQAQDLIQYIKNSKNDSEDALWETNIFGKSIEQIVEDGIQGKIAQMTDECQQKLQDAMQKIINDSNGGMICFII